MRTNLQHVQSGFTQAMSQVTTLTMQRGLSALNRNERSKIAASDTHMIDGSADIDTDYLAREPHSPRWDYVVGYGGKAYFVEIHPACTSNVAEMLKKLEWLKGKLENEFAPIDGIKATMPFHWIASSDKINILPTSKEYRKCIISGIVPKTKLYL